ncbi:MAG: enoyl-CoA hydratase/isomerase family protein, partial [Burkholderiales bacterium]|nr:enoyl-CoA hydratase/isomerase family protein [Burkholderiales bacterium]
MLEMNDPASRNALSRGMLAGLSEAIGHVDANVLGIVLTGGADCFSAGGDFRELKGTSEDLGYDEAVSAVVATILASDRIVVAAIEGPCMGAAADIALACDYRIAGAGGFVQIPAVRLGILYNPAAVERIGRSYPRDTVRRLLLAGERFDDHEARRAGPRAQLDAGDPDPAAGAHDHQRLASLQPPPAVEHAVGRAVGRGQAGIFDEARGFRQRQQAFLRYDDVFGKSAPVGLAQHLAVPERVDQDRRPRPQAGHLGPDRLDPARHVAPADVRHPD